MEKETIIGTIIGIIFGLTVMFFVMGAAGAKHGHACYINGYKSGARDYWQCLRDELPIPMEERHSEFRMTPDGESFFYISTVLDVK